MPCPVNQAHFNKSSSISNKQLNKSKIYTTTFIQKQLTT